MARGRLGRETNVAIMSELANLTQQNQARLIPPAGDATAYSSDWIL